MVYADGDNKLGGIVHTIKNTTASVFASKENELGVNTDKTNYAVKSRDKHAGQNRNMKLGNKSLESLEQFRYL